MNSCGNWFFCISIAMVVILSSPACADEMNPTITHVFFEKDGVPYNASVHYTVNCYGYRSNSWMPQTMTANQNKSTSSEIVYSYTATCDHYGCVIYEPYYLNYRVIDSCDLNGETSGRTFIIKNFSITPLPQDCTDLRQFTIMTGPRTQNPEYDRCLNASQPSYTSCIRFMADCNPDLDKDCGIFDNRSLADTPSSLSCMREAMNASRVCDAWRNPDEYYNTTPAYDQCMNESYAASESCNRYMVECNPASDKDCGNWIIDDKYVKNTPWAVSCRAAEEIKRKACDSYLIRVDPSTILMWKDPATGLDEGPAMRNCTARFTIPSEKAAGQVFVPPLHVAHIEFHRDTGSIWCRIMHLFGGRCE